MQNEGMSMNQQRRLSSAMKDFLDASIKQLKYQEENHFPDLDTYKSLRFDSIGWPICSILSEFAMGIDLCNDLLQHPLLCALQRVVTFHIVFLNDIYSFPKEFAEGDLINMVPILLFGQLKDNKQTWVEHLRNMPTENYATSIENVARNVVLQALEAVKDLDQQCLQLMDSIRNSSDPILIKERLEIEKYLQGISDWLAGCLKWHAFSARYVLVG